MNVEFYSNEQTTKNSALKVQNSAGDPLMYFDNDKGSLATRELSIIDNVSYKDRQYKKVYLWSIFMYNRINNIRS
ncbi:hypothetical protein CLPUN_07960 [Clostridium puniceum]|uniref:Uncharacterized protein n=1 Tax=Clostridium puniceum TaxID=29367 RepID=A0A1S8TVS8_9CLOT|nr:hypothetical protein [Clostridium puniceum]OOM81846.1 hypothetical protein CLPUN_07960 [Clostridium puniceum]